MCTYLLLYRGWFIGDGDLEYAIELDQVYLNIF